MGFAPVGLGAGGTVSGDLTVTGNLTVQGTTTSVVNQTTTGTVTITVQSATSLTVARTGANYALQVDTNTASSATGVKITAAAAGGGVAVAATSSGTNERLTVDAKGSGAIILGGSSTGGVGVGTLTALVTGARLQVAETATTALRGVVSSQHSAGTDAARYCGLKSRGTAASPTVITTGDVLARFQGFGYVGSTNGYVEAGGVYVQSVGTIADTSTGRCPSKVVICTGTDASPSVVTDRWQVDQTGQLSMLVSGTARMNLVSQADPYLGIDATTSNQQVRLFGSYPAGYQHQSEKINQASGGSLFLGDSGGFVFYASPTNTQICGTLHGYDPANANGGNLTVRGGNGNGTTKNGGNLYLPAGAKTSGGTDGNVYIAYNGSAAVGDVFVAGTLTATANNGRVSLGGGPWDGVTSGFFVGSASGTQLAINATSGYAGNLVDWQVAGSRRARVTAGGDLLTNGGANGQACEILSLTELTTIAAAATTDTAIQIPANARVVGVTYRVTVQPPGTATFDIGIAGATTRFGTGVSTAGNTTGQSATWDTSSYGSATALRFTPNASPSDNSGRIRVTIHYLALTAPTS